MNNKTKLFCAGLSAGAIASVDNLIKNKIEDSIKEGQTIDFLNGKITIQKHHNRGIPMNAFDDHQKAVAICSLIALISESAYAGRGILKGKSNIFLIAHSLILAGALSNTYDRLCRKYVVDYLSFFRKKAIYNMSDFCIFAGVFLALSDELKNE